MSPPILTAQPTSDCAIADSIARGPRVASASGESVSFMKVVLIMISNWIALSRHTRGPSDNIDRFPKKHLIFGYSPENEICFSNRESAQHTDPENLAAGNHRLS